MMAFEVGDLITDGSSAGTVLNIVDRDPRWKTSGVRVLNIGLDTFDGNVGYASFIPNYLLNGWRLVPMDWAPVVGGGLEERYVWRDGKVGYRLQRELRTVEL